MQNIEIRFSGTANFKEVYAATDQLNARFKQLEAETAKLNSSIVNSQRRMFNEGLGSSNAFLTAATKSKTATQQYTDALLKQELTLKDVMKSRKQFNAVLREQYQLEQMSVMNWTRNAAGQLSADMIVPKGVTKEVDNLTSSLGANIKALINAKRAGEDTSQAIQMLSRRFGLFNQAMASAADNLVKWGKNTQWAGRQLMVGFTVPFAALGVAAGYAADKVNQEMTRINKVYDFSATNAAQKGKQMADLQAQSFQAAGQVARQYGATMNDTLSVEADLAATGQKGADLIGATTEVMRAAQLGEMSYQDTVKATIALQTVFGYNTKQLSDAFNYMNSVENATNLTMQDFVTAIPKTAGPLKALGMNLQDIGLLLGAMKAGGIDAAEGANALKTAAARILNPTKAVVDLLSSMNININQIVKENGGNLIKVLEGLGQQMQGLSKLQQQQVVAKLFGARQYARMYTVIDGLGKINDQTTQMGRNFQVATQSTQQWAQTANNEMQTFRNSVSGKFHRALATIQADLASFGKPFLSFATMAINAVDWIIKKFNQLPSAVKTGMLGLAAMAAIAGPLVMIVGLFANLMGNALKFGASISGLIGKWRALSAASRLSMAAEKAHAQIWGRETVAVEKLNEQLALLIDNMQRAAEENIRSTMPKLYRDSVGGLRRTGEYDPLRGRSFRRGTVATNEEVAAYKAGESRLANIQPVQAAEEIATQSEKTARDWGKIGRNVSYLGMGVPIMANLLGITNTWVTKLGDAVFAASMIGPMLIKGLKRAGIASAIANSARSGASAITGLPIWGRVGSKIGGVISAGAKGALGVISDFAAPLALAAVAGGFVWSRIHSEEQKSIANQQKINNSAKDWADVLGFVYTEQKKVNDAQAKSNENLYDSAAAIKKKNPDLVAEVASYRAQGEQIKAINAAIQEGLKITAHGGNADNAKAAMEALLKAAGFTKDQIEGQGGLMMKINAKVDFTNSESELKGQVTQFGNQFQRIMNNQFHQGKWEGFSRLFTGRSDLNQAAGEAAKGMADQFWNSYSSMNDRQEDQFFKKFQAKLESQGQSIFESLGKNTAKAMSNAGITTIDQLTQAVKQYQSGNFKAIEDKYGNQGVSAISGMTSGEIKQVAMYGQAMEQVAREIAKKNGLTDKEIQKIHTLKDLQDALTHGTMTVAEAQKAYNTALGERLAKNPRMTQAQQLVILNEYRHKAGLDDATSATQGFTKATDLSTQALKNNADAAAAASEATRQDYINTRKQAFTSAQQNALQAADNIRQKYDQAQIDAINAQGKRETDALDAQSKRRMSAFDKESEQLGNKWDQIMQNAQYKWQDQQDSLKKSYDDRANAVKKEIDAEKAADAERQRIFDNEKQRLQDLAQLANNRIDFNVALNTGQLDQAAKIYNNMQAAQSQSAMDRANQNAGDQSQRRQNQLNAQIDSINTERDARLNALKRVQDAEKNALDLKKQREQDALNAAKQRYQDEIDAQKKAIEARTQNEIKAEQDLLDKKKRALDASINAVKASVPRTKAEYDKQIKQIEAAYAKYGVNLTASGNQWADIIGNNLDRSVGEAAANLQNQVDWKQLGANIQNQLSDGMFGLNSKEFFDWIKTGNLPKGKELNPGKPSKGTDTSSVYTIPNDWSGAAGVAGDPFGRFKHTGGPVDSGSNRQGRKGPLYKDEIPLVAKSGEYMMQDKAHSFYGTDFFDKINNLQIPKDIGGPSLGMAGLAAMSIAGMAKAFAARVDQALFMKKQQEIYGAMAGMPGVMSPGQPGKYGGYNLNATQLQNAAEIISVGKSMGASQRDLIVAIMTAMQESDLTNMSGGDRDSLGLFQQRPSQGWGTPEQIMNPDYAARKFFESLLAIKDRNTMPLTLEAQAVQRSAFPYAYAKWQALAQQVVSSTDFNQMGGLVAGSGKGYRKPLDHYRVSSPWGWRIHPVTGQRRLHDGIDMAAPVGTPIHATNAGTVIYKGTVAGGTGMGFGNYTVLQHSGGIKSGYGHQSAQFINNGQHVSRGQVIGLVGSTGISTGPHLHFQLSRGASVYDYNSWQDPRLILPSLKIGGRVKFDDTVANLHRNETVLTEPLSDKLIGYINNLDSGGNSTYDVTVDLRNANIKSDVDIERAIDRALSKRAKKLGPNRNIS